MPNQYLPILLLTLMAAIVPLSIILFTSFLGPKVKTKNKFEVYECGVPAIGIPRKSISVHFYKIAILFLLFDVEVALLFPWAMVFKKQMMVQGFALLFFELVLFLLVLSVGFFYAIKKGTLEWE